MRVYVMAMLLTGPAIGVAADVEKHCEGYGYAYADKGKVFIHSPVQRYTRHEHLPSKTAFGNTWRRYFKAEVGSRGFRHPDVYQACGSPGREPDVESALLDRLGDLRRDGYEIVELEGFSYR